MNIKGLALLALAALGLGGCDFSGKYKGEVEGEFKGTPTPAPAPSPAPITDTPNARNDTGDDGIGENSTSENVSEKSNG